MELKAASGSLACHCWAFQSHLYGIERVMSVYRSADRCHRFNRTFMELKETWFDKNKTLRVFQSHLYGIESDELNAHGLHPVGFNRTFMELKDTGKWKDEVEQLVSIAPLWNWKIHRLGYDALHCSFQSHLYGIESHTAVGNCRPTVGFNRTFMELKEAWQQVMKAPVEFQSHLYGIESSAERRSSVDNVGVSIAPLWNWKWRGALVPVVQQKSFNRTFMELKVVECEVRLGEVRFQSHL